MQGAHISISEFGPPDLDDFPFHSRPRTVIAALLSTTLVCFAVVAANGYFQRLGTKRPEAASTTLSLRLLPEMSRQASQAAAVEDSEPTNNKRNDPRHSVSQSDLEAASSAPASLEPPLPEQQSVDFYSSLQDVARDAVATVEHQRLDGKSVFDPRLSGELALAREQDRSARTQANDPYINASGETVLPISETCHLEIKAPALSGLVDFDRFVPPRIVCRNKSGIDLDIDR